MDGIIIIGVFVAAALIAAAAKKNPQGLEGMSDTPVSIENIRKGVERGWYKAVLCRVNGKPAVFLYGKDADGENYGDYYPISEVDWQTLKNEGYAIE